MNDLDSILDALRKDRHDESAWEAFHEHFVRQLIAFLVYKGVDRNDVHDLVSEVYVRFLYSSRWSDDWNSLPSGQLVKRYLFGVARSLASHYFEKRRVHARAADTLATEKSLSTEPEPFVGFNYVMEHLNPMDKELSRDLYDHGLSLKRIAKEYGVRYATLVVRIHRLRRKILSILRNRPIRKS